MVRLSVKGLSRALFLFLKNASILDMFNGVELDLERDSLD